MGYLTALFCILLEDSLIEAKVAEKKIMVDGAGSTSHTLVATYLGTIHACVLLQLHQLSTSLQFSRRPSNPLVGAAGVHCAVPSTRSFSRLCGTRLIRLRECVPTGGD